jgi:hypothetical protein
MILCFINAKLVEKRICLNVLKACYDCVKIEPISYIVLMRL